MKSLWSIGLAAALVLVFLTAPGLSAQISQAVEFTTSFPFSVGNATLPAGTYTIRPDDDNPAVLELSGTHAAVLFQTQDVQAAKGPAKTEVVFNRYGTQYVLKDIWLAGSDTGAELITVESEHHAAKHGPLQGEHRVSAQKTGVVGTAGTKK